MAGHLDAIVSLYQTLTELDEADRRLNTIPDWMQELHQEHSAKKEGIDAVAAVGATADHERREAEAALADAQEKLKHYQEQLSRVSTQREYGALLKEIDTTKNQIRSSEQVAIEAGEREEQSKAEKQELEEAFRELDERYKTELAKWEQEKPAVEATIRELKERLQTLRSSIPRNFLTLFDRIYDRSDGQALSRILKIEKSRGNTMWHCEVCSFNVRPQILVEIRESGSLVQCDSCKRILYWQDEEQE